MAKQLKLQYPIYDSHQKHQRVLVHVLVNIVQVYNYSVRVSHSVQRLNVRTRLSVLLAVRLNLQNTHIFYGQHKREVAAQFNRREPPVLLVSKP